MRQIYHAGTDGARDSRPSKISIRNSVVRELLFYSTLFFIVLVCISMFVISMMSDAYSADIRQANSAQLAAELNSIEDHFTQIQTILYSARNQVAIKRLLEDRTLNNALIISLLRDEVKAYFDGLQLNVWAKFIKDICIIHGDAELPNVFGLCMYDQKLNRAGMEDFWKSLTPCGTELYMRVAAQEDAGRVVELFAPVRSQFSTRRIGAVRLTIEIEPMLAQALGESYPTAAVMPDGEVVWSNALWTEGEAAGAFMSEWLMALECEPLQLTVQRRFPVNLILEHGGSLILAACGLIAVLVLMLLMTIRVYRPFVRQLRELLKGIERVRNGTLDARVTVSGRNELTLLGTTINDMLENIENLMKRIVAADDAEKRAVYKSLSNQIRPHFLNNALDKVRMNLRVQDGDAESARMLERIMRYISYNLGKQTTTVALDEELKNVSDYIRIYEMAYGDSIQVDMVAQGRLRGNLHRYELPKFTLLPVVENCIHHGFVENKAKHRMVILLSEADGAMCIQVEDNGVGMPEERRAALQRSVDECDTSRESNSVHGIGLPLVRQRLKLFYGMDVPMTIESYSGVGTLVSIRVPFSEKEGMHG